MGIYRGFRNAAACSAGASYLDTILEAVSVSEIFEIKKILF